MCSGTKSHATAQGGGSGDEKETPFLHHQATIGATHCTPRDEKRPSQQAARPGVGQPARLLQEGR